MIQFFETQMGRKFFEVQLPNLIKGVARLADLGDKAMQEAEAMELKRNMDKSDFWRGIYENVEANAHGRDDVTEEDLVEITEFMVYNNDYFSQTMNEMIVEKMEEIIEEREPEAEQPKAMLSCHGPDCYKVSIWVNGVYLECENTFDTKEAAQKVVDKLEGGELDESE